MNKSYSIQQPTKVPIGENVHKPSYTITVGYLSIMMSMFDVSVLSECTDMCAYPESNDIIESQYPMLAERLSIDYGTKADMLNKLDILKSTLREDWDAEGALPVEEESYRNARAVIESTPVFMLRHWHLIPVPNGTLQLSPTTDDIAGVSIGNKEFSYAAYVSDDKQISGKEPFDASSFQAALRQIHRILGYEC